jgi:indoleamine 2,3-dioxygenase
MDLASYDFDRERGFLPTPDPLETLPEPFAGWEEIGRDLPKLLVSDQLRQRLGQMPPFPVERLRDQREVDRAMLLLSYLGQAYVWGGGKNVPGRLPAALARPWYEVAQKLDRPPILSYASYALHNWRRLDPERPIELGNIGLLQNFLGGRDEEWFVLIHVGIEAKAGPALAAAIDAQDRIEANDVSGVTAGLERLSAGLQDILRVLARMPEGCDPYIYYNRVRPYIHGWRNNPALPGGLVYEGVDAYGGQGQHFNGETGAQSSIVPCLDALLGIQHASDPLREYLLEMKNYMPAGHRRLINDLASRPSLRDFVLKHRRDQYAMVFAYNDCVTWVAHFRSKHLEYAAAYIHNQAQRDLSNPTAIGTGGTPFMPYLRKHRDESRQYLIDAD